ncbi:MAG: cupin domain-containing protein [Anaerolineales bacterium]
MSESMVRVQPWSDPAPPSEAAVWRILEAEGLRPYSWSNGPGDVYAAHQHSYHKVIYLVTGSITFGLPGEGRRVTLNPGDRLELPPGVVHDAVVGPRGVVCLEAHRA